MANLNLAARSAVRLAISTLKPSVRMAMVASVSTLRTLVASAISQAA